MGVGVGSVWLAVGSCTQYIGKMDEATACVKAGKVSGQQSHSLHPPLLPPFPPPPLLPSTSIVRRNFGGGSQRYSCANSATYSGMGAKDSSNNLRAGELNSLPGNANDQRDLERVVLDLLSNF